MFNFNDARAVIITPTTGSSFLEIAVKSVLNQNYKNALHLIVVDGIEFHDKVKCILDSYDDHRIQVVTLPFNTGGDKNGIRYNGHRIYAGFSFLTDSKYTFFLDEDNWYDADHLDTLINLIEYENLDWAYSLRKIYDINARFIAKDDCESLGKWPPYSNNENLVDTNCYAFRTNVLSRICHKWYYPLGADRYFFKSISRTFKKFETSSKYTLNYRLDPKRGTPESFFLKGNRFMEIAYEGNLPWRMNNNSG